MSWSVVAAVAGVLAVIVTIVYGEIERRLARRQLALAQEQAELRPSLEVSLGKLSFLPYASTAIANFGFELRNVGRAAAHNVECTFEFEREHFRVEIEGIFNGAAITFRFPSVPPLTRRVMAVPVQCETHGLSRTSYYCSYDEGNPVTGTIEFEIPNPEGEERA